MALLGKCNLWSTNTFARLVYNNLRKVFAPHKLIFSKCTIYGQVIKSGTMIGIKIYKYREHTVLVTTLVKI